MYHNANAHFLGCPIPIDDDKKPANGTVLAHSSPSTAASEAGDPETLHRRSTLMQGIIATFPTSSTRLNEDLEIQAAATPDPFITALQQELHAARSSYQSERRRRKVLQRILKSHTPSVWFRKCCEDSRSRKCPICMERHCDYSLFCGHLFCELCVRQWKADSSECPICRAPLKGHQIYK